MKAVAKHIKNLRIAAGLNQTQFAEKVGVKQGTISKWESGTDEPRGVNLQRLADVLGVEPKDIVGFGSTAEYAGTRVRIVGELAAGDWKDTFEIPHEDQEVVTVQLDDDLANLPIQGFKVSGDSMNQFYPDGSVVYVAPLHALPGAPMSGDHVMVMRHRDGEVEGTIKEFVRDEDGKQWLWPRSSSPMHQAPLDYKGGKRGKIESVVIAGVVVAALVKRPSRYAAI